MREKLINLIAEICEEDEIITNTDMDIVGADLLDSMAFAELLVAIEDEFGVVISPSEVDRKVLNTPEKIVSFVMERM